MAHRFPILIPCNYAKFANAIVLFLRAAVLQHLTARNVDPVIIAEVAGRIHLVTRESRTLSPNSFGNRLMRNADEAVKGADVIVATFTMQAGVSIQRVFKCVFPFFHTGVGSFTNQFQAVERLRYGLDAQGNRMWLRTIMFLQRGNSAFKPTPEAVLWERAHLQLPGQSDLIKAAMVSFLLQTEELMRLGPSVWGQWCLEHDVRFDQFIGGADMPAGRAMVMSALPEHRGGTNPAPMSPADAAELACSAFGGFKGNLQSIMASDNPIVDDLLTALCVGDGDKVLHRAVIAGLVSGALSRAPLTVIPACHGSCLSLPPCAEIILGAAELGRLNRCLVRDGATPGGMSELRPRALSVEGDLCVYPFHASLSQYGGVPGLRGGLVWHLRAITAAGPLSASPAQRWSWRFTPCGLLFRHFHQPASPRSGDCQHLV